jgi:signal transduction histidine kinase
VNFRVSARIVSQLGAELISSDDIAVYELVKNGFDAQSEHVEVQISFRASVALVRHLQEPALSVVRAKGYSAKCEGRVKAEIVRRLEQLPNSELPHAFCSLGPQQIEALAQEIRASATVGDAVGALGKINSIDIIDYGQGMTKSDVERYYLTIGTTHRLREIENLESGESENLSLPSGEKGIGRLSAMRLGNELDMYTVPRTAKEASLVSIHWRQFEYQMDADLADIPVAVDVKPKGEDRSGTFISISDLNSDWTREKSEELGSNHLAKFIDPFRQIDSSATSSRLRRITLKWNGESIDTLELIQNYLRGAQNWMVAKLFIDGATWILQSDYHFGEVRSQAARSFTRRYSIADFSGITEGDLATVGPLEILLYHFPRNRLKAIPQFATRNELLKWLNRWSGGLMIYRDGIRVLPYAAEGNDWLGMDGKALRGRGFRVNRIQVVGCVRISRLSNPGLIDQTNREGLRDNPSFQTFYDLIYGHIQDNFVSLLDEHLSEEKGDVQHLAAQTSREYDALQECAIDIESATKSGDWALAKSAAARLRVVVAEVGELNNAVERALQEKEGNRLQILELAATGMAAESMAHDLEGVVETAITTLGEAALGSLDKRAAAAVKHIRAVHKSLLTQIKQISPGPARSRRRASILSLQEVVSETASFYHERATRHGIKIIVPDPSTDFRVKAVSGHIRQILDNLFRNSIFWVDDTRRKYRDLSDFFIKVELDHRARRMTFSDSGVGISSDETDWVFRPFNSKRKEGRGLGLYICKELAQFNGINLYVDASSENRWKRHPSLILDFNETDS